MIEIKPSNRDRLEICLDAAISRLTNAPEHTLPIERHEVLRLLQEARENVPVRPKDPPYTNVLHFA